MSVTWDECKRARWEQNAHDSWVLKMPVGAGGAILARVGRDARTDTYTYTIASDPHFQDWCPTLRGAMRRARWEWYVNQDWFTGGLVSLIRPIKET